MEILIDHSRWDEATHRTLEHEGQLAEASIIQFHDQIELAHEQRVVGAALDLFRERLKICIFGFVLQAPVELHHMLTLLQNSILALGGQRETDYPPGSTV